jgi:dihydropteroate synthase
MAVNAKQLDHWLKKAGETSLSSIFRKPLIMGILNVTADSFSDGGTYLSVNKACDHAYKLIQQGADIIDIGGESSKPGASPVSLDVELDRVIPVIQKIRQYSDVCISIDTYKPEVMKAAVEAGAHLINDIYALRQDGALAMAAHLSVPVCLMHMKGRPQTMQNSPCYNHGVMNELLVFFAKRIEACISAGIEKNNLILDPGFGFGKEDIHNMNILHHLETLYHFDIPILLGVSRKSTLGRLLNKDVDGRLTAGIAVAVYAAMKGVAIIRTHDVDETIQALHIIDAIHQARVC